MNLTEAQAIIDGNQKVADDLRKQRLVIEEAERRQGHTMDNAQMWMALHGPVPDFTHNAYLLWDIWQVANRAAADHIDAHAAQRQGNAWISGLHNCLEIDMLTLPHYGPIIVLRPFIVDEIKLLAPALRTATLVVANCAHSEERKVVTRNQHGDENLELRSYCGPGESDLWHLSRDGHRLFSGTLEEVLSNITL